MAALHDGGGLRRARALLPPAWRTAPPPAVARIGVAQARVVRDRAGLGNGPARRGSGSIRSGIRIFPHFMSRCPGSTLLPMGSDNCFRVSAVPPDRDDPQARDWIVALAGGEGTRLQDYVRRRFGWQLPKQYCPLLGSRSPLQHTLMRLNHLTPPSPTLTVIGPTHAPYAMPQLARASDHVFRQPASRGTGVALYVALAMIRRWSPGAVVTVTPTDHYVEPNARYIQHLQVARNIAARMRDVVVILGVRPSKADPDLGYLSVGPRLMEAPEARRLVDFVEKPSLSRAQELVVAGGLWNTMVMCGTVDALWSLARATKPHLIDVLDS